MGCLRLAHLPSKAAERRFLDRVPLPADVRADLWLDEPADWSRLADAAESWAFRRALDGRPFTDREELAGVWWRDEVLPVITRLRDAGKCVDLRDVETYAVALATRDHHGWHVWPEDLPERVGAPARQGVRRLGPIGRIQPLLDQVKPLRGPWLPANSLVACLRVGKRRRPEGRRDPLCSRSSYPSSTCPTPHG